MALLIECPQCKRRNPAKEKACKGCGFLLAKHSGRIWWIEYYDHERRLRRERIGPNKAAAEQRYREVRSLLAEGRFVRKCPDAKTTFKTLADWYLNLPEVKAKRSYSRDERSLKKLLPVFGDKLLKDITPAMVEKYRQDRLSELSYRGNPTKPATVNREMALLKIIFNKAIANEKAEKTPVKGLKMLKENNARDRVLSEAEYLNLINQCPGYLRPIVKVAYHTGMRQGEILSLTWGQIDLKEGFITLRPEDTKTNEARLIPLNSELMDLFKGIPRGLPQLRVFLKNGNPITSIRESFQSACRKANITDFTFHDLRHTFTTNMRRAGIHDSVIMAITGHKTTAMFLRYNTVGRDELRALVREKI
ncbi:integrase family protein [Desulfobacca acetoxidans DSM 11109]|uniref:Integrase family protein n=1 Tax=Desulfobacca acetoxidans (strain ATCC 700848 / DSM 11109 / ASRB2) TaxID=880072 RepID=F2NG16_DESAR|nr:integrase family protein [Desulfobacca acetoxidans DSM 11109]